MQYRRLQHRPRSKRTRGHPHRGLRRRRRRPCPARVSQPVPGVEGRPACPDDGWVMATRWPHHRSKRHIRADYLAPVLTGQVRTRLALAGPTAVPGPHPDRSYPQGAITFQGETLFQQPDRRMHGTGLGCTSLHGFRATAIFYPDFYPEVRQSGAKMLYVLVMPANWSVRPGCVTSLPSWSCGFDSRRPLQLAGFFRFCVLVCPRFKYFYRATSLPIRCLSSSIAILELSYVNVRGRWDYPSFYPKCQQP